MRYSDQEIRGVRDLVGVLTKEHERLTPDVVVNPEGFPLVPLWFRGMPRASWKLATSMARISGGVSREQALLNRFKQNAYQFLTRIPQTEWEWLFLMRHHGLPSRLLDWTESPLVGLYFAVTSVTLNGPTEDEAEHDDEDGVMWCLVPSELNKIATPLKRSILDIPLFHEAEQFFWPYLPESIHGPSSSGQLTPVAGIASRDTLRIQAQQGVFTINGLNPIPVEDVGYNDHVWRYVIPKSVKARCREQLRMLGITVLTVFPQLDSVSKLARDLTNV